MKLILKFLAACSLLATAAATVNDRITKSTEIAQSTAVSTTTYQLSSIDDSMYAILVSPEEYAHLSHSSVSVKGGETLPSTWIDDATLFGFKKLLVQLPPSSFSSSLTLTHSLALNTINDPLPREITQDDLAYSLSYKTYTHVVSPYHTHDMRVKIRTPTPKILKYGMTYDDSKTTKNGGVITYGPWIDTAPYSIPTDHIEILYEAAGPRLAYEKVDRSAQVSHWGNTISYRDDIILRNIGPSLKGQFTRLTHQAQSFLNMLPTNVATLLEMRLPNQSQEVWFVDQIGNVTTSHLKQSDAGTVLQLKPRYPLMGGWKYSFSVGWENTMKSVAKVVNGLIKLSVPFSNTPSDVAVHEAVTRIILPEGAHMLDVSVPFEGATISYETTYTYLDTIGRPTVVVTAFNTSAAHNKDIVVVYSLSILNAARKPLTVSAAAFALFMTTSLLRRINTKI
ncbi:hypothetical protein E3P99_00347 [Wallemia hederae]|uniref:Dolichyl-diphosphooligosaccharide--protein glycosyltransferase subunit 1 n=1 Tax=Wallemia hederae TaxID=1540922 RepID=A0A4T0FVE7_9BASI|nr:hypothetical protein E3P99_00347 [Wallemia hederae]